MSAINSALIGALRSSTRRATTFVHSVVFGRNLLLTNALISAGMGAIGDSIQQNYDILMQTMGKKKAIGATEGNVNGKNLATTKGVDRFDSRRTVHMTAAGLTTGVATHYWYIILDRFLGVRKAPIILAKKILIDQIVFSPVNLFVYFTTLGICERSNWRHVKNELVEKGLENIYVAEWIIWPPCQLFNFAVLPLRYRILFDNVISLGFDIYSPYVKYKTELKCEAKSSASEQSPSQLKFKSTVIN